MFCRRTSSRRKVPIDDTCTREKKVSVDGGGRSLMHLQFFSILDPAGVRCWGIETTIEPDKKGGFGVLPLPLIVLCGGNPQKFVRDLESAHLSGSTHFWGS
eukprot:COSAG03_NODE_1121_length_4775_cov_3.041702_2_plen_101_part_00